MAIISAEDKMRIQTLREQGLGARKIKSRYPDKKWSLAQIHRICKRVDETGSSLQRKPGSGRPKTARTAANITAVETLICSQEDQPGTSRSTRQISMQIGVSRMSVARMAKEDLRMKSFKRVPARHHSRHAAETATEINAAAAPNVHRQCEANFLHR